jgi:hypothetical protein
MQTWNKAYLGSKLCSWARNPAVGSEVKLVSDVLLADSTSRCLNGFLRGELVISWLREEPGREDGMAAVYKVGGFLQARKFTAGLIPTCKW